MNASIRAGRPRVAVVGLGSVGGVVAAALAQTGNYDVLACTQRPLAYLAVETPRGTVDVALANLTDPTCATPVDWVVLATKTFATASAAPWLAALCGPATRVAVLQNGIDHVARVAPYIGAATVIPGLVYFNGERSSAELVRFRPVAGDDIVVPDDAAGVAFAALLAPTFLRVVTASDVLTLAWRKLLLNAIANPLTALALRRNAMFASPDVQALCRGILDEAVAVAGAAGARLTGDEAARTLAVLLTYPPDAGTSMYFDRINGRPLETEALTGAIVAAGERFAIPTPINRTLLVLLRAVDGAP